MSATILFVGHDAHRGGAEIALLHILTWLRAERLEQARVLLLGGGDLVPDYERLAPTYRAAELSRRAGLGRRVLRKLHLIPRPSRVPSALERQRVDLVYLNTVAVAHLARTLKTLWNVPILLQLRELEMAIRFHCGTEELRAALEHIDGCVTGVQVAADLLMERYGLSPERIHRVPSGLTLPTRGAAWSPEARRALRGELGIPAESFVVGGCGSPNWWKAPELFVLAAHRLRLRHPQALVHFVWVGGHPQSLDHERLRHDVDRLGLGGMVRFLPTTPDPHRHFALFDAFLLTSREDTNPFVCIEAAALGLPVVCFGGSGGAPEFVEQDAGFIVPYLDFDAMAERLVLLMSDHGLRHRIGEQAARKAKGRHARERMGEGLGFVLDRYLPDRNHPAGTLANSDPNRRRLRAPNLADNGVRGETPSRLAQ